MNTVRQLNNKGIMLTKARNVREAIECFMEALITCQSIVDEDCQHSEGCYEEEMLFPCLDTIYPVDLEVEDLFDNNNFVYWKAMKIKRGIPEDPVNKRSALICYSFACVFNLAMVHHLIGRAENDVASISSSPIFLKKAINLYEQAYGLLTKEIEEFDPTLLLAVVNNLGSIYNYRGNSTKATKYSKFLLSLLMFVSSTNITDSVDVCPETNFLWERCFSNVSHLVLRDRSVAPAA